jgi:branched-chain amino acid transport system ATP-binding protein
VLTWVGSWLATLDVDSVASGYGKVPIVTNVSLRAEPSAVTAIVGPNGSGKSTLLKAICGLLKLSAGRVVLCGQDLTGRPPHVIARSGLGYVPQVGNAFPRLTVTENLEMGGYARRGDLRARLREVLDIFPDLAAATHKHAGALSAGQRNLLGTARALMADPQALLLDEPTAGLSPAYTRIIWEQVKRIAEAGTAVVVVEQNVDLALHNAAYVYVLVRGRNHLEGLPDEVGKHDLSQVFLGVEEDEPSMKPINAAILIEE